jgi:hypothetical protein
MVGSLLSTWWFPGEYSKDTNWKGVEAEELSFDLVLAILEQHTSIRTQVRMINEIERSSNLGVRIGCAWCTA